MNKSNLKTIKLRVVGPTWFAGFASNGAPDEDIVQLFGTHVLPTAYTSEAKGSDVLREIKNLNASVEVFLSPEPRL